MFWNVTMSQVYRELNKMLSENWLNYEIIIQEDKPNKKIYSITEKGRSELMKWLFEYNGEAFFITRNSFLVNLFFSSMKDISSNITMLKRFKEDCVIRSNQLLNTSKTIPEYAEKITNNIDAVYWDIVADLGRTNITETIKWVDRSISRLEGLK